MRVVNERDWQSLWSEHQFGKSKEAAGNDVRVEFDFSHVIVIAVFQGKGILCCGYKLDSILETKDRLTLRVRALYYQLSPTADSKHLTSSGWGVFVIPRSDKQIVLEQDVRLLVNDPPKWKKWTTISAIEPPRSR